MDDHDHARLADLYGECPRCTNAPPPGARVDPGTGRPLCSVCGQDVSPTALGTWVRVTGWAQNRAGGGTHALADRVLTSPPEWVHDQCMKDRKHAGQGAML